jgi:hypothetical protein
VARSEEANGIPVNLSVLPLEKRVPLVLSAMLKVAPESLPVDADGDIGIRSGSAMVFVRVRKQALIVDVFSPVLLDVEENQRLYHWAGKTVWAGVPVFGRDFQATHLMLAVEVMTGLADELDDRLSKEFGGRRFFGDGPEQGDAEVPAPPATEERIGQYL